MKALCLAAFSLFCPAGQVAQGQARDGPSNLTAAQVTGDLVGVHLPTGPLLLGVGELHGAVENAAFVEGLVTLLRQQGRVVTVLVEEPLDSRGTPWDAPDEATARERLLASGFWSSAIQDGREGQGRFCMLRRLRANGVRLLAVDVADGSPRDAYMAQWIIRALHSASPNDVIVYWAGDYHVQTRPEGSPLSAWSLATAQAPQVAARRFLVDAAGGSAWNCTTEGCAVHSLGAPARTPVRGLRTEREGMTPYNVGVFTPDMPLTPRLREAPGFAPICAVDQR